MTTPEIPLGARVAVKAGVGYVRWTGVNPSFSEGKWVGVELETPTGKNNGSVQNEQYFDCKQGYGVFVRPSQVTVIDLAPAPPAPRAPRPSLAPRTPGSATASRLSSAGVSRASTPGSRNTTSTPASRAASGAARRPPIETQTPSRSVSAASRASTEKTTPPRAGSAAGQGTVKRVAASSTAARTGRPSMAPGTRPPPVSSSAVTPKARRQSTVSSIASPVPSTAALPHSARPPSSISLASTTSVETAAQRRQSTSSSRLASPLHQPAAELRDPDALAMPPPPLPVPQSPARGGLGLVPASPVRSTASSSVPWSPARSASGTAVPASPSRSAIPSSPTRRTSTSLPVPQSPVRTSSPGHMAVPSSPSHRAVSPISERGTLSVSDPSKPVTFTGGAPLSPRVSPRQPLALSVRSTSPDRETAAAVFAQKRELDELRIKVRLLDTRHNEDLDKIKVLEKKATDADQLHAVRAKLQTKFQEQQAVLVNSQRLARDLQSENAHLETRAHEAMEQLEMATLDREVAEEKAEAAESDLSRMSEKVAELEMEVAVLKEENAEYEKPISGVEGAERSSLAFVQLEKHNERLKEALIRLRDVTSESEKEHRAKITDLEKELASQEDLQSRLNLTEARLSSSEEQVDDLKQQLDDALGAEDLLEELTERNLQMSERLEEMHATIEDLEALKELNDELEENHVATAKQLEEEISVLTNKLRDETGRSGDLEAVVVDMEATIGQFRELVANLQSEIDTLRVLQATKEYESATASKESQTLMNLNLKLQSSAAKTQSKTIDLELKKLEAAQLTEHLRIVQAYLPDPYLETEADSTTALLFFYRVASKVDMLINVISHLHGLPAALHSVQSEALVGVCELRGKLHHFATLNRRFAAVMRRASPDDWVSLGRVVGELTGVETRVDGWVGLAKADTFNEGDCARELVALIAQFNHLAEVMFNHPGLDAAEQQLDLAYNFDDDLDNFAAAVGFVRQAVVTLINDGDIDVEVGESTLEEAVYEPVQRILNQVRAVKAPAGKLVSVVEEAVAAETALLPEFTAALGDLVNSVSHAVDLAVQVAQRIGEHIASVRASKEPLRLDDIAKFLAEVTNQVNADQPPWDVIGAFITRIGTDLADTLPKFRGAAKASQTVSLAASPPWLARVASIKEAATHSAEAEHKVSRLSEEVKEMLREIKIRDQSLQESGVKIETLEHRLEASRRQADMILELENDIAKAKKQEKVYEEAMEQLQAEYDTLEAENSRLRKNRGSNTDSPSASGYGEMPLQSPSAVEATHLVEQIEALRGAVRFLRSENALLKSRDMYDDINMLAPLRTISVAPLPPLPVVPALPLLPDLVGGKKPNQSSGKGDDDSDAESEGPVTPRTSSIRPNARQALDTESKLLLRELARYSAAPRIVDISGLGAGGPAWRSRKNSPEAQVFRWANERRALEQRVEDLGARVRALRR